MARRKAKTSVNWAFSSFAMLVVSASIVAADPNNAFELPSGLLVQHNGTIFEDDGGGLIVRDRYFSPDFSKDTPLETITADLEFLCRMSVEFQPDGVRIIVSLSDAPTEFGVANPEIAQVFEAFRAENGRCIWEEF